MIFLKDATTSMLRQILVLFQDEHVPYERGRVCARSAERPGVLDQGGITCGAIDDPRKSSKAIDERVIINFRDKNVVIARFCDKNWGFY